MNACLSQDEKDFLLYWRELSKEKSKGLFWCNYMRAKKELKGDELRRVLRWFGKRKHYRNYKESKNRKQNGI